MEVIDNNQIDVNFLPLRFILDNILHIHESIQWAKELHQVITFLKLDFTKAYDRVYWTFIFQVMGQLGMVKLFHQHDHIVVL